jgi:DNA polymerase III delta prime subunit
MKNDLWVERWRPKTLEDYVWSSDAQREQVKSWVTERKLPHILMTGHPGVGKTSLALMLLQLLNVDNGDIKFINGCTDNGIDVVRDLENFVNTMPMGEYRYVLIDECLDESTLVWVKSIQNDVIIAKPINSLDPTKELVMSYNVDSEQIEWLPYTLHDKGLQEVYEIQLDNGEVVICTESHKWYVQDSEGNTKVVTTDQLHLYNHILSP